MGRVRHVRNGGEVQVLTAAESYYVDGFDEETNTVFEFYGCWYHGCSHCFKHYRDVKRNSHQDRTVNEVYDATLKKAALLRQAGYTVVEKWECVFKKEKKRKPTQSYKRFSKSWKWSLPSIHVTPSMEEEQVQSHYIVKSKTLISLNMQM